MQLEMTWAWHSPRQLHGRGTLPSSCMGVALSPAAAWAWHFPQQLHGRGTFPSSSYSLFCITCLYSAYSLTTYCHLFTRLFFWCSSFSLALVRTVSLSVSCFLFLVSVSCQEPIAFNEIDMSCKLLVRVSDQHDSLFYFGHWWAHFILAIYCYNFFCF